MSPGRCWFCVLCYDMYAQFSGTSLWREVAGGCRRSSDESHQRRKQVAPLLYTDSSSCVLSGALAGPRVAAVRRSSLGLLEPFGPEEEVRWPGGGPGVSPSDESSHQLISSAVTMWDPISGSRFIQTWYARFHSHMLPAGRFRCNTCVMNSRTGSSQPHSQSDAQSTERQHGGHSAPLQAVWVSGFLLISLFEPCRSIHRCLILNSAAVLIQWCLTVFCCWHSGNWWVKQNPHDTSQFISACNPLTNSNSLFVLSVSLNTFVSFLVSDADFLHISPNRLQHFQLESLSLHCVVGSLCLTWITNTDTDPKCDAVKKTSTGSTCTLDRTFPTGSGEHWCEIDGGQRSSSVNVTVTCTLHQ